MTNNEINEAIAKLCGWREIPWNTLGNPREAREQKVFCPTDKDRYCGWLPNFAGSLDAMRDAVQQFRFPEGGTLWSLNQHHLRAIVIRDRAMHPSSVSLEWEVANATARQRAEAFLRVKGAWVE